MKLGIIYSTLLNDSHCLTGLSLQAVVVRAGCCIVHGNHLAFQLLNPHSELVLSRTGFSRVPRLTSFPLKAFFSTSRFYRATLSHTLPSCVCPSVCLSQVRVLQRRRNHRITQTTPLYDSPETLDARDLGEIATGSPTAGAPNRGGVGSNRQFATNVSLYRRNGAR